MYVISDGTGTGSQSKVDAGNRLHVYSISQDLIFEAARNGEAYNLATGNITVTSSNPSQILYLKNTGTQDIILTELTTSAGSSTGGTGVVTGLVYKNITGGTIVSNANDVDGNTNLNFGSSKELPADAYKGAEGATQTGGTLASAINIPENTTFTTNTNLFLPKDTSISFGVIPPSGNTSFTLNVALLLYLDPIV